VCGAFTKLGEPMGKLACAVFLSPLAFDLLTSCGWQRNADSGEDPEAPATAQIRAGWAEAERDIGAGTLKLKVFGYPPPWYREYARLLKAWFGVKCDVVGGCVVSAELINNAAGYNDCMEREIAKRFGQDALEKVLLEAQKTYEEAGR
jgi:hypothetical protein